MLYLIVLNNEDNLLKYEEEDDSRNICNISEIPLV